MTTYFSQQTPLFKALSDETRLKIVQMLTCQSLCANEILECFNISQPSLSYHMKILVGADLVRPKRQGGFTIYTINRETLQSAIALLQELDRSIDVMRA